MFSSVGWGEVLILLIAGLVILGPERLPGAVTWAMKSLRQVREYASGATSQLKDDLGPEFEDFRKPLADLNELRGMTPRSIITKHLLDGDDSFFTGEFGESTPIKPVSAPMPQISPKTAAQAPSIQSPSIESQPVVTPLSNNAADPAFDLDRPPVVELSKPATPDGPVESGAHRPRVVADWDAT